MAPLLQRTILHPRPDRGMPDTVWPALSAHASKYVGQLALNAGHDRCGAVADESHTVLSVENGLKRTCKAIQASREHDHLIRPPGVVFAQVQKGNCCFDSMPRMVMESEGISVLGEKAERLGQKPVCRLVFPNLATADGNLELKTAPPLLSHL